MPIGRVGQAHECYFAKDIAWAAVQAGCDFSLGVTRNKAAWRAAATIPDDAWRNAKRMKGAQVAVCDYAPAGWPPDTTCVVRRVKVRGRDISTDPRARRRRTIPKDQLALALDGLVDHVYAYSFIAANLDVYTPARAVAAEAWHRMRTDIEDRIRDAKHGAALRHLPSATRAANTVWMWGALLAVNLSAWLQELAGLDTGDSRGRAHLGTLRHRLLTVPARQRRRLLVLWFGVGPEPQQCGVHGRIPPTSRQPRCENGDGRRLVVLADLAHRPLTDQHGQRRTADQDPAPEPVVHRGGEEPARPIGDRVHARTAALTANCIDSSVSGAVAQWRQWRHLRLVRGACRETLTLVTIGDLLAADPTAVRAAVRLGADLSPAVRWYLRCVDQLTGRSPDERAALYRLAALQAGGDPPLSRPAGVAWWPVWSRTTSGPLHLPLTVEGPVRQVLTGTAGGAEMLIAVARTVTIHDLGSGALRGTLRPWDGTMRAAALGDLAGVPVVVTASDKGGVAIWDLATGDRRNVGELGRDRFTGYHARRLDVVAFVPGVEPVVVTGSAHGDLHVWQVPPHGTRLPEPTPLSAHRGAKLTALAAGPSAGRPVLVSGDERGRLHLWDPIGTQLRHSLAGHDAAITALATGAVHGAPVAVSTGRDGTARVWDLATGELRQVLAGPVAMAGSVILGNVAGTPVAVTTGTNRAIRVWDLVSGTALWTSGDAARASFTLVVPAALIEASEPSARVVGGPAAAPAGAMVLGVAQRDGRDVRVHDAATGVVRATLAGGVSVTAVAAGRVDGTDVAVTGQSNGVVRIWDLDDLPRTEPEPADQLLEHGYAGAEPVAVIGHMSKRVWSWLPRTGACRELVDWAAPAVPVSAFGALDGTPVAVLAAGAELRVWDLLTGEIRHTLDGRTAGVRGLRLTRAGGTPVAVGFGTADGIRVWDLGTGQLRHTLPGLDSGVAELAVADVDGATVAVAALYDSTARVWDLTTGRLRHVLTGHDLPLGDVACGRIGDTPVAVTAGEDHAVVWDLRTGERGATLVRPGFDLPEVEGDPLSRVVLADVDGATVAVTSVEYPAVTVWDLATGSLLHTLSDHGSSATSLVTGSVDGVPLAATTGRDATIRVSDLRTGELLATIPVNAARPLFVDRTLMLGTALGIVAVDLYPSVTLR